MNYLLSQWPELLIELLVYLPKRLVLRLVSCPWDIDVKVVGYMGGNGHRCCCYHCCCCCLCCGWWSCSLLWFFCLTVLWLSLWFSSIPIPKLHRTILGNRCFDTHLCRSWYSFNCLADGFDDCEMWLTWSQFWLSVVGKWELRFCLCLILDNFRYLLSLCSLC